ncbi:hypothetical protein Syun_024662 [Stephania yunnanensis]|uniref:Uncharacterized protein n=1 Tax=Stephania yunnanensis TaxID=152371 RepID=A0AAP0I4R9_9MAGN
MVTLMESWISLTRSTFMMMMMMMKNENKKIVYPKIESSTDFEASLYPSISKIEAWCPELEYPPPPPPPPPPLEPPGIHYPPTEQIHYELAPCGLFGSESGSGRGLHHDHNWMSATAYPPTNNDYFCEFGSWQHNYPIAGQVMGNVTFGDHQCF